MQLLAVHSCMSLKQLYNQFRFDKHLLGFVTEYQTSPTTKPPRAPLSFVGGLGGFHGEGEEAGIFIREAL